MDAKEAAAPAVADAQETAAPVIANAQESPASPAIEKCNGIDVDISSIKDHRHEYLCDSLAPMFVCGMADGCACGN